MVTSKVEIIWNNQEDFAYKRPLFLLNLFSLLLSLTQTSRNIITIYEMPLLTYPAINSKGRHSSEGDLKKRIGEEEKERIELENIIKGQRN